MLSPEQQKLRLLGIGGSDAAAVMGMSPYTSPLELWLQKLEMVDSTSGDSLRLRAGSWMEPFVKAELARGGKDIKIHGDHRQLVAIREHGLQFSPGVENYNHPRHDYMRANTDGMIFGMVPRPGPRPEGIVEIKTSDEFPFLDSWKVTGVPEHIKIQCQHYMECFGADYTIVACLQGLHTVHVWRLEKDDDFVHQKLIPAIAEFWGWVESRTPPPADDSESCGRALEVLFPEPIAKKAVALDDHTHVLAESHIADKERKTKIGKRVKGQKNFLLEAMQGAAVGKFPNGQELHWVKAGQGWTFKMKESA